MDEMKVWLEPEMQRRLQEAARQRGRSAEELIHEVLAWYLHEEAQRIPRSIGMGEDGEIPASEIKTWLRPR